uniref:Uncharacterized protein n=1 Tax=Anopheles farauti TaxID=69004 RepID=A0A182QS80_9DIPT
MNSNFNILLNSVGCAEGSGSIRPCILPPLVPCTAGGADSIKQEPKEAQTCTEAKTVSSPPMNVIKIDTDSNLFNNLRHVLSTINTESALEHKSTSEAECNIAQKDTTQRPTEKLLHMPMPLLLQPGLTVVQQCFKAESAPGKDVSGGTVQKKLPLCNKIQLIVKPVVVSSPPSLVPISQQRTREEKPPSVVKNDKRACELETDSNSKSDGKVDKNVESPAFGENVPDQWRLDVGMKITDPASMKSESATTIVDNTQNNHEPTKEICEETVSSTTDDPTQAPHTEQYSDVPTEKVGIDEQKQEVTDHPNRNPAITNTTILHNVNGNEILEATNYVGDAGFVKELSENTADDRVNREPTDLEVEADLEVEEKPITDEIECISIYSSSSESDYDTKQTDFEEEITRFDVGAADFSGDSAMKHAMTVNVLSVTPTPQHSGVNELVKAVEHDVLSAKYDVSSSREIRESSLEKDIHGSVCESINSIVGVTNISDTEVTYDRETFSSKAESTSDTAKDDTVNIAAHTVGNTVQHSSTTADPPNKDCEDAIDSIVVSDEEQKTLSVETHKASCTTENTSENLNNVIHDTDTASTDIQSDHSEAGPKPSVKISSNCSNRYDSTNDSANASNCCTDGKPCGEYTAKLVSASATVNDTIPSEKLSVDDNVRDDSNTSTDGTEDAPIGIELASFVDNDAIGNKEPEPRSYEEQRTENSDIANASCIGIETNSSEDKLDSDEVTASVALTENSNFIDGSSNEQEANIVSRENELQSKPIRWDEFAIDLGSEESWRQYDTNTDDVPYPSVDLMSEYLNMLNNEEHSIEKSVSDDVQIDKTMNGDISPPNEPLEMLPESNAVQSMPKAMQRIDHLDGVELMESGRDLCKEPNSACSKNKLFDSNLREIIISPEESILHDSCNLADEKLCAMNETPSTTCVKECESSVLETSPDPVQSANASQTHEVDEQMDMKSNGSETNVANKVKIMSPDEVIPLQSPESDTAKEQDVSHTQESERMDQSDARVDEDTVQKELKLEMDTENVETTAQSSSATSHGLNIQSQDGKHKASLPMSAQSQKMVKVVLSNSALFELYEAAPRFTDSYPPALKLITPIKYQLPSHVVANMGKPINQHQLATKTVRSDETMKSDTADPLPDSTQVPSNAQSKSEHPSATLSSCPIVSPKTVQMPHALLLTPPIRSLHNALKVAPPNGIFRSGSNSILPLQGGLPANTGVATYMLKNNTLIAANQGFPNILGLPPGMATNLVFLASPTKPAQAKVSCPGQTHVTSTPTTSAPTTPAKSIRLESDDQTDEDDENRVQKRRSKRLQSARLHKQQVTPEKTDSDTDTTVDQSPQDRRRRSNRLSTDGTNDNSDEVGEGSYAVGSRSRSFRIRRKPEFLNIKHPEKKKKRPNEESSNETKACSKTPMSDGQTRPTDPCGSVTTSATNTTSRLFTISAPVGYFAAPFVSSLAASSSTIISQQEKYKRILTYYKTAMQQSSVNANANALPQWYDVNYAYSGLHSIIHPPPPDANLWGASPMKLDQQQQPLEIECKFCFENYSQYSCQFYPPQPPEFAVKSFRRGKVVVCECCDFSDGENEKTKVGEPTAGGNVSIASTSKLTRAADTRDTSAVDLTEKLEQKRSSIAVELDEPEPRICKRTKGEPDSRPDGTTSTGNANGTANGAAHKPKVKPGWYGKGYRKHLRRKKRTSQG